MRLPRGCRTVDIHLARWKFCSTPQPQHHFDATRGTHRPGAVRSLGEPNQSRRVLHLSPSRGFFTSLISKKKTKASYTVPATILIASLLVFSLYPADDLKYARLQARESSPPSQNEEEVVRNRAEKDEGRRDSEPTEQNAWTDFAKRFEYLSRVTEVEWSKVPDKVVDLILPEWSKSVPGYVRKLQRELSMAPGSLADEIWLEAHDPSINPEIQHKAQVRVSDELCTEENEFLARRKLITKVALAKYLGLNVKEIHPDDVPVIAVCGSGGGLRALVAGAGSLAATTQDGLFDCVTYTSGVSGSCWLQTLYHSSLTNQNFDRLLDHLRARLGYHIAYPPTAFSSVTSAPTNKILLSGIVEKLKGDPDADFGLVDVYGLLLAARLLVPRGELGVQDRDFKISNQRQYVKYGQNPMPIYTAVRHEIPDADLDSAIEESSASEEAKEKAKQEAWFQWFEITPYELFCEEFGAGIPTWAMGRRFRNGVDEPAVDGLHLPETRLPLLLGIFGSAFCATLSHYYKEIRPIVQSLTGFGPLDEMISGHNENLSKVHPIDPGALPNPVYGMNGKLPKTAPDSVYNAEYLQLMDAGMSNNIPLYPFLRPGRNVDVVVAFDASADIRTDNWLSVADGYARQRGIRGWPVGIGWPRATEPPKQAAQELEAARADSTEQADRKVAEAQVDQAVRRIEAATTNEAIESVKRGDGHQHSEEAGELGYCTVWVGSTQERSTEPPPPSKAITDATSWQLMEPDAGIAIVYLPFLTNDKVEGVDPATSEYMSTWNFVYTPEQIDKVVALARANYDEGREQIRATVRAVYERKKKVREDAERQRKSEEYRRLVRLGINDKLGEGDHFN